MTKYVKKEPKIKYLVTYKQNTITTKEHRLRLGASKT